MKKQSNLKKDFLWNSLGSTIHAFNSLFFLIIVTRVNGIDAAGYFSYGFALSNIFLTIATFGGRSYQITDIKKEFSDNTYKNFRYLTTIITLILSILLFLLFKYPAYKYITIILLIITRSIESISDVYFGILQKNDELYKVGKSLFYKNLISLILFISIELIFKNLTFALIAWILTNIIFLIFVDIRNCKKVEKDKFKIQFKNCIPILKKTSYFFMFSFLSIFILNIPRYFIDYYLTDELQGIYGILIMPATFIILLSQFILQPYAVRLADNYEKDKELYKKEIIKIFKSILGISILCIVCAYFLGIPVLNIIYNLDLHSYKYHLLVVMLGASFYAFNSFLSLIYTIKRNIKYQFIIYFCSMILSLFISNYFVKNYAIWGGIISYSLTMFITLLFYAIRLRGKK